MHQDYEKPEFGTEVPVRRMVVEKPVYYGLFGCTFSIVLTAVGPGLISIPYAANVLNSFQLTLALNAFCVCVMASGAECLIRVRKNIHTIFLRNRHAQLSQLVTTERQLKALENDHFQYPKFSLSDLSFLLFGKNSLLMTNLFLALALIGFMLLFFEFLEYTIIGLVFNPEELKGDNNLTKRFQIRFIVVAAIVLSQIPIVLKR